MDNLHTRPPTAIPKHIPTAARLLVSPLFLISGIGKLRSVESTQKYMEAYGVSGSLLYPAAGFELTGGLMLLAAAETLLRPLGIVLAGWCMLTAWIFHTDFADANQMVHFLKNLAMAGGFLVYGEAVIREARVKWRIFKS